MSTMISHIVLTIDQLFISDLQDLIVQLASNAGQADVKLNIVMETMLGRVVR